MIACGTQQTGYLLAAFEKYPTSLNALPIQSTRIKVITPIRFLHSTQNPPVDRGGRSMVKVYSLAFKKLKVYHRH
jgi:hypothetical protein